MLLLQELKMKADDVLAALPRLSKAELQAIAAAASHLEGNQPQANPDRLYDAVAAVIGAMPYGQFQASAAYRDWRKHAPQVNKFFDTTFPNISTVTRLALTRVLVGRLVSDLQQAGVPVSIGVIVKHIGRLPVVFDQCFPGYKQNGMAQLVVLALERSR